MTNIASAAVMERLNEQDKWIGYVKSESEVVKDFNNHQSKKCLWCGMRFQVVKVSAICEPEVRTETLD